MKARSRYRLAALAGMASLLGGVLPACAKPSAVRPSNDPLKEGSSLRYLAMGDSFTAGSSPEEAFPERLALRWRSMGCAVALHNVAVAGFTSEEVVRNELSEVARFHPTFVTLTVGANDIVRGAAVDVFRRHVRTILGSLRATGARVVVVPQPDWSRTPVAASLASDAVVADAIVRFNEALEAEARTSGATWMDLFPLMKEQAGRAMVARDGLHPSAQAYDAWAEELARALPRPCPSPH